MELSSPSIDNAVMTFVHSTIFNQHIGPQDPPPISGQIYYTKAINLCDLTDNINGMIVFMDKTGSVLWDVKADVANMECISAAGAIAAVNAYGIIVEPGMGFNLFAPVSNISIPLFHVAIKAIPSIVFDEIKRNNFVTANVTAEENAWLKMWESQSYKIVWTRLFPIMNGFGVTFSLLGIVLLSRLLCVREVHSGSMTRVRRFNIRLLILGNLILLLTCGLRLFYCINDPMYKSETHNMAFHFILLNVTIVWEAISSIIGIAIFIRWASFGVPPKERLFNKILAVMAAAGFPVYLVITIVNFLTYVPITAVLQPLLMTFACVIVTLVYLYRTLLFMFRTYQHRHRKGGSYSSRMRIGLLMNFAALMNVVIVVALIIALHPYFYTVNGRYTVYTMLFFGLSFQALAQILAFMPAVTNPPMRKSLASKSEFNLPTRRRKSHDDSHAASFPVPKVVYPPGIRSPELTNRRNDGDQHSIFTAAESDGVEERVSSSVDTPPQLVLEEEV
eukprot:c38821_g1_i1.p1 GENE.c38821_g1_i1~~c38821_g1_i1.p1  ORF type:complete len:547 (+),score=81.87 c38821_g1_i1:130-1641(+)